MSPLLDVEKIDVARAGDLILKSVQFSLYPGQCLWVSGPNGIGKTSLLRVLAGISSPAAGRVVRKTPCAWLGHLNALKSHTSVLENLLFWLQLYGCSSPRRLGLKALESLDVAHLEKINSGILSFGQSRRVALAAVVASGRKLWILDEPFTGLDQKGVDRIRTILSNHCDEGGSCVFSSHHDPKLLDCERISLTANAANGNVKEGGNADV